ncbi:MAG: TRL-like family protein [Puniceicoccales bacterium]|jgi:hypothetical protein|nr:TRL-like family protein [Puniceicoccales bacterium]
MKNTLLAVTALSGAAFLAGCAAPDHYGALFSNTTHAKGLTNNTIGSKTGQAKLTNILGIAEGDASLKAAAKAGNITKVATVDVHIKNILGVYSETTLIVTGE